MKELNKIDRSINKITHSIKKKDNSLYKNYQKAKANDWKNGNKEDGKKADTCMKKLMNKNYPKNDRSYNPEDIKSYNRYMNASIAMTKRENKNTKHESVIIFI